MSVPISQERLWSVLDYSDSTGLLIWRKRPTEWFDQPWQAARWNRRFAGKEALATPQSRGYKKGNIFGKTYYAHQIVWCWKTGQWPEQPIDHIDGDRTNNRWANLQMITLAQNAQRAIKNTNGTSQYRGVCLDRPTGKWRASITANGRRLELGLFKQEVDAARAYPEMGLLA